jgi:histidyl-tRNA synthetase
LAPRSPKAPRWRNGRTARLRSRFPAPKWWRLSERCWANDPKAAIRAEGERLLQAFVQAGAVPVEADLLQPAETLLDLYGEDIRARAYVTDDPVRGEMMLRPDFTVPVVQAHMAHGADPARYAYLGEVFRKQARGSGRASEYLQVGYEVFDRAAPRGGGCRGVRAVPRPAWPG